MKQRIISALVAVAILLPILLIGGKVFYLGATVITILALLEMLKAKETEKPIPLEIKILSLLSLLLIMVYCWPIDINIDLEKRIVIVVLTLLIPLIVYRKDEKYNISDAFFLVGIILLLGLGFNSIGLIRIDEPLLFVYMLSITIITDTFAYIGGKLIGQHKLAKSISPNKTIEGLIVGVTMSTIISSIILVGLLHVGVIKGIIITIALSLVSQAGDLLFSAIKRHFKIKDYGTIMPGHGGVLDRLDSLLVLAIVLNLISKII